MLPPLPLLLGGNGSDTVPARGRGLVMKEYKTFHMKIPALLHVYTYDNQLNGKNTLESDVFSFPT